MTFLRVPANHCEIAGTSAAALLIFPVPSMSVSGKGQVRPGVLFISSAEQPGADTFVHMLVMKGLDRMRFDVHLACPPADEGADPYAKWLDDGLHVRRCRFGPSLTAPGGRVRRVLQGAGGVATLLDLARYVRRHRIG